ncbi:MAG: hypothetical protein JJE15_06445 [Desulfobacteraceae bacterium]|nr:hypothetical protein [Desulfobacteraceae bacterium]
MRDLTSGILDFCNTRVYTEKLEIAHKELVAYYWRMTLFCRMKWKNEKLLLACVCIVGIIAVAYGMSKENDLIFILGLLFIIPGYLLIRRKLKANRKKPYHL